MKNQKDPPSEKLKFLAHFDQMYFDLYIKVENGDIPAPNEYFGCLISEKELKKVEEDNPLYEYLSYCMQECELIDVPNLIPKDE